MLLVLGFDVYKQTPEATLAIAKKEGFDGRKIHEDTWEGKPVYVFGAQIACGLSPPRTALISDALFRAENIDGFPSRYLRGIFRRRSLPSWQSQASAPAFVYTRRIPARAACYLRNVRLDLALFKHSHISIHQQVSVPVLRRPDINAQFSRQQRRFVPRLHFRRTSGLYVVLF